MACITEAASGFPDASGVIPPKNGQLQEILGAQDWNTYMVGKWHLCPDAEMNLASTELPPVNPIGTPEARTGHDPAEQEPDRLRELINLWYAEAGANGAFPLDDRGALEIILTPRPVLSPPRDRYVCYPGVADVPESQAVNVRNRSYAIGAVVDIHVPGAHGVLFAHGSRFGGHALYVKDNRLHDA